MEIRQSGIYRYVLVVEEVGSGYQRAKRTLENFGPDSPDARRQAEAFVHAVNAGRSLRELGLDRDELERVILGVAGGILTAAAIGALLALIFGSRR